MRRLFEFLQKDGIVTEHNAIDVVRDFLENAVSDGGLTRAFLSGLPLVLFYDAFNAHSCAKLLDVYDRYVKDDLFDFKHHLRLDVPTFGKNLFGDYVVTGYTSFKQTDSNASEILFDVNVDVYTLKNHKTLTRPFYDGREGRLRFVPYFTMVSFCDTKDTCMRCDNAVSKNGSERPTIVVDSGRYDCNDDDSFFDLYTFDDFDCDDHLEFMFDVVYKNDRLETTADGRIESSVKPKPNDEETMRSSPDMFLPTKRMFFRVKIDAITMSASKMTLNRDNDSVVNFKIAIERKVLSDYFSRLTMFKDVETVGDTYAKRIDDGGIFTDLSSYDAKNYAVEYVKPKSIKTMPCVRPTAHLACASEAINRYNDVYNDVDDCIKKHYKWLRYESSPGIRGFYVNSVVSKTTNTMPKERKNNRDDTIHGSHGGFRTHCSRDDYVPQKRCVVPEPSFLRATLSPGAAVTMRVTSLDASSSIAVLNVDLKNAISRVLKTITRFVFSSKCRFKDVLYHASLRYCGEGSDEYHSSRTILKTIRSLARIKRNVFSNEGVNSGLDVADLNADAYRARDMSRFLDTVRSTNALDNVTTLNASFDYPLFKKYKRLLKRVETAFFNVFDEDEVIVSSDTGDNNNMGGLDFWKKLCSRTGWPFRNFVKMLEINVHPLPFRLNGDIYDKFGHCLRLEEFVHHGVGSKYGGQYYAMMDLCLSKMTRACANALELIRHVLGVDAMLGDNSFYADKCRRVNDPDKYSREKTNTSCFIYLSKLDELTTVQNNTYAEISSRLRKAIASTNISKDAAFYDTFTRFSAFRHVRDTFHFKGVKPPSVSEYGAGDFDYYDPTLDGGHDISGALLTTNDTFSKRNFAFRYRVDDAPDKVAVDELGNALYDSFGCCDHLCIENNYDKNPNGIKNNIYDDDAFKGHVEDHRLLYSDVFQALRNANCRSSAIKNTTYMRKTLKHFRTHGGIPTRAVYDASFYESKTCLGLTGCFDVSCDPWYSAYCDGSHAFNRLSGGRYDEVVAMSVRSSKDFVKRAMHNILKTASDMQCVFLFDNRRVHDAFVSYVDRTSDVSRFSNSVKRLSSKMLSSRHPKKQKYEWLPISRTSVWIHDYSKYDDLRKNISTNTTKIVEMFERCGMSHVVESDQRSVIFDLLSGLDDDSKTTLVGSIYDLLYVASTTEPDDVDGELLGLFRISSMVFDVDSYVYTMLHNVASKLIYNLMDRHRDDSDFDVVGFTYVLKTFIDVVTQRVHETVARRVKCEKFLTETSHVFVSKNGSRIVFSESGADTTAFERDDGEDRFDKYSLKTIYQTNYAKPRSLSTHDGTRSCKCHYCVAWGAQIFSNFGGMLVKRVVLTKENRSEADGCRCSFVFDSEYGCDLVYRLAKTIKMLASASSGGETIKIYRACRDSSATVDITPMFDSLLCCMAASNWIDYSDVGDERSDDGGSDFTINDSEKPSFKLRHCKDEASDHNVGANIDVRESLMRVLYNVGSTYKHHCKTTLDYARQISNAVRFPRSARRTVGDWVFERMRFDVVGTSGRYYGWDDGVVVPSASFLKNAYCLDRNGIAKSTFGIDVVDRATERKRLDRSHNALFTSPHELAAAIRSKLIERDVDLGSLLSQFDVKIGGSFFDQLCDRIASSSVTDDIERLLSTYKFVSDDVMTNAQGRVGCYKSSRTKRNIEDLTDDGVKRVVLLPRVGRYLDHSKVDGGDDDAHAGEFTAKISIKNDICEALSHQGYYLNTFQLLYRMCIVLDTVFDVLLSFDVLERTTILKDVFLRLEFKMELCFDIINSNLLKGVCNARNNTVGGM